MFYEGRGLGLEGHNGVGGRGEAVVDRWGFQLFRGRE